MRYLVASGMMPSQLPQGCDLVADGEAMSFEQPWDFGAPLIARVGDDADLDALEEKAGVTAFIIDGNAEPDEGQGFAIGAHRMLDPEGFKPYAAGVPAVIKGFGCTYIARGNGVTRLAGSFVPDGWC
jgi:hypothetical protein